MLITTVPHPLEHALQLLAARVRGDPAFAPFAAVCVVGGALRDALLGRDALEVDLAVPGDAGRFAALAAEALGASTVVIGREPWRLHRVPLARGHLDAVAMQGPLADDLARRDFTVNAL
ncbi:MAG: CCA tRNA nucleotidyltransferase, partial [Chloroflexi bacterium]|nr:CCA tRNA nucleotidyltransferase [Chloroflexota bacterium]